MTNWEPSNLHINFTTILNSTHQPLQMNHTNTTLKPRHHPLQTQPLTCHKADTEKCIETINTQKQITQQTKPQQRHDKRNGRPRLNIP